MIPVWLLNDWPTVSYQYEFLKKKFFLIWSFFVCLSRSFTRPQIRGAKPIAEKLFSNKKCLAWFHEYAGPDKVVGPEAMEKFCEDIGVEPENVSPFSSHLHPASPWPGHIFPQRFLFPADYHVSFSLASRRSKYGLLHKRRVAQGNDSITVRKL